MPAATFDTLKFANTLKAAGVPPQQAEAQAIAFAEVVQLNFKDLATKDDLKGLADTLRQEIAQLGKELGQELEQHRKDTAQFGKELRQEMADGDKSLRQEMADGDRSLRQEIKDLEQRLNTRIDPLAADVKQFRPELKAEMVLLKWTFGAGVTLGVTMLGIVLRLLLTRLPG